MIIPGRRRWVLWHMGCGLRRSDPHLAAMLAIFAGLTAGEAIDSIEQGNAVRRVIAGLGRVLAAAAARLSAGARGAMRRIGLACAEARWRFRLRRAAGFPSDGRLPGARRGIAGR